MFICIIYIYYYVKNIDLKITEFGIYQFEILLLRSRPHIYI